MAKVFVFRSLLNCFGTRQDPSLDPWNYPHFYVLDVLDNKWTHKSCKLNNEQRRISLLNGYEGIGELQTIKCHLTIECSSFECKYEYFLGTKNHTQINVEKRKARGALLQAEEERSKVGSFHPYSRQHNIKDKCIVGGLTHPKDRKTFHKMKEEEEADFILEKGETQADCVLEHKLYTMQSFWWRDFGVPGERPHNNHQHTKHPYYGPYIIGLRHCIIILIFVFHCDHPTNGARLLFALIYLAIHNDFALAGFQ